MFKSLRNTMTRCIVALSLSLGLLLSPSPTTASQKSALVSFEAEPRFLFHYNGSKWGEITYIIRLSEPSWICTGWRLVVPGMNEDETPQRWHCRVEDFKYFTETWGGPRYPFPYFGEYEAVLQVNGVVHKIKFEVREGIPAS